MTTESEEKTQVSPTDAGAQETNNSKAPELGVTETDDAHEKPAVSEEETDALDAEERRQRIALLKPILEGALLAVGGAMPLSRMQNLFEAREKPSKDILTDTLIVIQQDCEGRGFHLVEVASGWRFQVRDDYATWVNRLWEEKPQKYSRALLETLSLIAYRQPLTRGDIEEVRGVAVSSHIIKTLIEREWVKIVGHRDVPGRPALYATSKQFLDYFGLNSLEQLPTLGELKDIDSLNASLELTGDNALSAEDAEHLRGGQNSDQGDLTPEASIVDEADSEHEKEPTKDTAVDDSAEAATTDLASAPHEQTMNSDQGTPNV